MTAMNTRLLVADYIKYRLDKDGLAWDSVPVLPQAGRIEQTLRVIGTEFEQRYNDVFTQMCNQLHITPSNCQPTFVAIVGELFSDGIKWGRIVALFAFGGALAVQCVQREMPLLVDQVLDWVTTYIDNHLQSWILEHGNWTGFVEFYENGPEHRQESPWPSLSKLAGLTLGAIGAVTLGAFLAHKS